MDSLIQLNCGAIVYPSKSIPHPKGDILHALKVSDPGFVGFGEVYFSNISAGEIKGWKKHSRMHMNLVVPIGTIRFYLRGADGKVERLELGLPEYNRLYIPSGIWVAFEGVGAGQNMLMNFASIPHDPTESINEVFDL